MPLARGFLRRIQLTGGSTYIVSLPKEWIKSLGMNRGDYVVIQPQPDGSLRIVPSKGRRRGPFEASMVIREDMTPSMVMRDFISRYLAGYDIIKVKFVPHALHLRDVIKDVIQRKVVGMEVIEESADELVIQCLAKHSELPVRVALRRMANITQFMLDDLLKAIETGNRKTLEDIPLRDDSVDKFYIFILRQLKMVMSGLLAPSDIEAHDLRECLGLRLVIKSIERIADHIASSAQHLLAIKDIPNTIRGSLLMLGKESKELYIRAIDSFFKGDAVSAHRVADEVTRIRDMEAKVVEDILGLVSAEEAIELRLSAESFRRIAEYSTDISEITINLAVPVPTLLRK
ncbi:MAG: hypothetical protein DRN15_05485 [Thermoprotei archaeon]|nr:MAG: hypothetical protein DRM97_05650 [Thermoprotei archaeon]RLF23634.1 MAG: hypothetical protein DRN15_05485 [Thermoprotei archaeon]